MFRVMSLHQMIQTMVAIELFLSMKANLMFRMMSLHQPTQTIIARELCKEMTKLKSNFSVFTLDTKDKGESWRVEEEKKQPRNYPMLHLYATSYIAVRGKQTTCSYSAVVYLITLTG